MQSVPKVEAAVIFAVVRIRSADFEGIFWTLGVFRGINGGVQCDSCNKLGRI